MVDKIGGDLMAGKPIGKVAMTPTERQRRWRARVRYAKLEAELTALRPKRGMREQTKNTMSERGLDAYFTPIEALISLLHLERAYIPRAVADPMAGDGAIVKPMASFGYRMFASDLADYGLEGCQIVDYRDLVLPDWVEGIVANPPFAWALEFLQRAITQVPYVAFLLRSHFLIEAAGRKQFRAQYPVTRTWHASLRLPRMHRFGWTGKRTSSQTPYSWCVWDRRANHLERPDEFNWRAIWADYEAGRLDLGPM